MYDDERKASSSGQVAVMIQAWYTLHTTVVYRGRETGDMSYVGRVLWV